MSISRSVGARYFRVRGTRQKFKAKSWDTITLRVGKGYLRLLHRKVRGICQVCPVCRPSLSDTSASVWSRSEKGFNKGFFTSVC